MNQVTLDPIGPSAVASADTAAPNADTAAPSADVFRTALADQVRLAAPAANAAGAKPVAGTSAVAGDDKALQTLESKIKKMLDAGASPADVITTLASQLASSVAQSLDIQGAGARATLQAIFAAALAPPGTIEGAGGSAADRARSLAQRFLRLEKHTASITGKANGQQKRIAGNFLDAQRAKDIPARTKANHPDSGSATLVRSADAATQIAAAASLSGAQPAAQTAAASAATPSDAKRSAETGFATAAAISQSDPKRLADTTSSGAPAPGGQPAALAAFAGLRFATGLASGAGDGRRVNLGSSTGVATGGDTGFGRILTRAALAADARQAALLPGTDGPQGSPLETPASATAASAGAATSAPSSDTALSAFIESFEAALNGAADASTADKPGVHDAQASSTSALPAGRDVTNAQLAFVPAVAPFTIDRVGPAPAPAPAAAPDPVDHSAIADQVLRGAFMKNVGQSSEIRLSLVPDSLGDVSVKLVVEAGNVTAHVVAETPAVRDALIAAEPQLNKSLADAGLKLSSFTVDLSGSGFAGFSQQQHGRSPNGNGSGRSANAADDAASDEMLLEAIPSFSPSTSARPNAGDYNYLA